MSVLPGLEGLMWCLRIAWPTPAFVTSDGADVCRWWRLAWWPCKIFCRDGEIYVVNVRQGRPNSETLWFPHASWKMTAVTSPSDSKPLMFFQWCAVGSCDVFVCLFRLVFMVTRKYDFFTWRRSVSLSKRSGTDSALNSKRATIYEKNLSQVTCWTKPNYNLLPFALSCSRVWIRYTTWMFVYLFLCCPSRVALFAYACRRTTTMFMRALLGWILYVTKTKYLVCCRLVLSQLYECHINMSVLSFSTAVNLETIQSIHVCHWCHVDVFSPSNRFVSSGLFC